MSEQPTGVRGGNGKAGRPLGVHELERELEDTRQEMRGTIEALLSEKLSPDALMRQARDAFGGPAEFADNLGAVMRRNPVPATLTAVGLAWLFWSDRHPARPGEGGGVGGAQMRESMKERAAAGRERLHDVAEGMRARRENMAESARLTGIRANRMMNDAGDYGRRMFDEQPFLVGALGLAIGALVGATLPRTGAEEASRGEEEPRQGGDTSLH